MESILLSSGFTEETINELRQHWHVIEIPSQREAMSYLEACDVLPKVLCIGNVKTVNPDGDADWAFDDDGYELPGHLMLREIQNIDPDLPVIISTNEDRASVIVKMINLGAFDYVVEGFNKAANRSERLFDYNQELRLSLQRAVQWRESVLENRQLKQQLHGSNHDIITRSKNVQDMLDMANKVAPTPATVLITGESGTGKGLLAKHIHEQSQYVNGPFLAINCGSLSESLLSSELFGHAKGAFTGADADKVGLIQEAAGGTLFLDEIATVSQAFQVALLRVLEEKQARAVGANEDYTVTCRIIAAANRNLEQLVESGEFREDLFYRLNMFHLELPALHKRQEDISALAHYFLHQFAETYDKDIDNYAPDALRLLESHHWPGNIRELRNTIERAVILCDQRHIEAGDLNIAPKRRSEAFKIHLGDYHGAMQDYERKLLQLALHKAEGNQSKAAKLLNMKRPTLIYRLKQLNIQP